MRILHACPGNNYNFRVRLTHSWLLFFRWAGLVPVNPAILYIEKRQGSIVSEFLKILFEQVCKRFVGNILDAFFVYNAVVPQSRESPTRFSKKQKQEGKKKISKKAFTSRPMNRRNFSSRGLLVSILLNSRPWKRWCASLKLGIWIKIIKGIVHFDNLILFEQVESSSRFVPFLKIFWYWLIESKRGGKKGGEDYRRGVVRWKRELFTRTTTRDAVNRDDAR